MTDDKQIYQAIKKGNHEKVFSWLYKHSFPTISAYILKNNGSADDARDIFQDTVLIIFRNIKKNRIDENKAIAGLMYTVAKNIWIDKMRRNWRNVRLNSKVDYETEYDELITESIELRERETEIENILKQLGDTCFQIIKELIKDDKNFKEIADLIGLKDRHVVKAYKNRCKNRLIKLLENNEPVRNALIKYEARFKKYI